MIFHALVTALVWCAVMGTVNLGNALSGAILGAGLWAYGKRFGIEVPRGRGAIRLVLLLPEFLLDLVKSNLVMAVEVFKPLNRLRPGFVRVPIEAQDDTEVMVISQWVTLTPGTMTVDVEDDRSAIYVHAAVADNAEQVREAIGRGVAKKVRRALRG